MTPADKIKLIDELIRDNPAATIRDYITELQSIEKEISSIHEATNDNP